MIDVGQAETGNQLPLSAPKPVEDDGSIPTVDLVRGYPHDLATVQFYTEGFHD